MRSVPSFHSARRTWLSLPSLKGVVPSSFGHIMLNPLQWYHQHFNNGKVPARFVKLGGWNNDLYPFTTTLVSDPGRIDIDYPDEDPRIREIFKERLSASGGQFKMPESVFKRG